MTIVPGGGAHIGSVGGHFVVGGNATGDVHHRNGPPAPEDAGIGEERGRPERIVYAVSDPSDTARLGVMREIRAVERLLDRRGVPDIEFDVLHACTAQDLLANLTRKHTTIVSFSGHATREGLVMEDEAGHHRTLTYGELAETPGVPETAPALVMLNACYSVAAAKSLLSAVPAIVGMKWTVGDAAACAFAEGFYDEILAGNALHAAMNQGIAQLSLCGHKTEVQNPQLEVAPTVAPAHYRILRRPAQC